MFPCLFHKSRWICNPPDSTCALLAKWSSRVRHTKLVEYNSTGCSKWSGACMCSNSKASVSMKGQFFMICYYKAKKDGTQKGKICLLPFFCCCCWKAKLNKQTLNLFLIWHLCHRERERECWNASVILHYVYIFSFGMTSVPSLPDFSCQKTYLVYSMQPSWSNSISLSAIVCWIDQSLVDVFNT